MSVTAVQFCLFDHVVVNSADISLKNITYQSYEVYGLKLHLDGVQSDMQSQHQGNVSLWLNSNMAQADLNGTYNNDKIYLLGTVEGKKTL